jgi:hypothetical protein
MAITTPSFSCYILCAVLARLGLLCPVWENLNGPNRMGIGEAGVVQRLVVCGIFGRERRIGHEEDIWRVVERGKGDSSKVEGGGLVVEEGEGWAEDDGGRRC